MLSKYEKDNLFGNSLPAGKRQPNECATNHPFRHHLKMSSIYINFAETILNS